MPTQVLIVVLGLAAFITGTFVRADDESIGIQFSDIEIVPAFRKILVSDVLLMEVTGAKIVLLSDNRKAIVGVASTAMKDNSATDRLRAEKVCKIKALANVVGEKQGIQVVHLEELKDQTRIVVDAAGEKATSVSSYIAITKTKVEGIAKGMPVVGRWRSRDGGTFYLAIGVILDDNGEPISANE